MTRNELYIFRIVQTMALTLSSAYWLADTQPKSAACSKACTEQGHHCFQSRLRPDDPRVARPGSGAPHPASPAQRHKTATSRPSSPTTSASSTPSRGPIVMSFFTMVHAPWGLGETVSIVVRMRHQHLTAPIIRFHPATLHFSQLHDDLVTMAGQDLWNCMSLIFLILLLSLFMYQDDVPISPLLGHMLYAVCILTSYFFFFETSPCCPG